MPAQVQADVGDVVVRDLVVPAEAAGLVHDGHVDAGLLQLLDVLHRQEAHVAAVGPRIGREAAEVDALAHRAQLVQHPAAHRALEAALVVAVAVVVVAALAVFFAGVDLALAPAAHLLQEGGQGFGLHAQELHVHLGRVDGDDRQAAVLAGRQHEAAAGEVVAVRHGLADRVAGLGRGQLAA